MTSSSTAKIAKLDEINGMEGVEHEVIKEGNKIRVATKGHEWENTIGYNRAVRVGNTVHVAGTTAPGETVEEQTERILQKIKDALEKTGSKMEHVVRTRVYMVDIDRDWRSIASVTFKYWGEIRPTASWIEVSKFIKPELLVEIEAYAVIPE